MAARTTKPEGKKPDKLWHHAIMRAVKRPANEVVPDDAPVLEVLAYRLVQKGMDLDVSALKEVGDRLDGKPAQSIAVGQDPELDPVGVDVRPPLTRDQWLKIYGLE